LHERWNSWLADHPRWAAALLCLLTFVVFGGTLAGQFVFDDIPQVLENPFVANPSFWRRIFLGSVWSFRGSGEHDNFYRPLQFLTYWLLYRAGGPNPALFHLFQLLLCVVSVWLVYRLGRELLGNELAAFAGALLWGLHPQRVETVAWVSALPDAGAACFSLLAFLLFLRAEHAAGARLRHYALAALADLPALFFKESAVSFPLLVLVYWFFLPGGSGWKHKAIRWLPFAAAVVVYLAIRITILGSFSQGPEALHITRQMFATAFGLLGQHAKLFFWPAHLSAFRVFELTASLHSVWPWLALLLLAIALLVRRREPILGFLIFWWVVGLLPCLDIRMVSFPVADRFSYLPSVGLSLALAYVCLARLPQLFPLAKLAPGLAGLLALGSIAYAVQDVRLVPTWRNNEALWTYSLHAAPNAALVHLFQATLLRTRDGNLGGAAAEYRTALRLNAANVRPLAGVTYECYLGLGQIALMWGRTSDAINYYEDAVRLAPSHSPAYKSLGATYFPRGDYKKAAEYFTVAVRLNPQDVESRFFLGTCALKLGEPRQAAAQFRAARQVDPTYIEAYEAEVRALEAAGDAAEAARVRALIKKQ
jgi:Flp pilus assembly protein TadD